MADRQQQSGRLWRLAQFARIAGLFVAVAFVSVIGAAPDAKAEYRACNETSYVVRAAVAFKADGEYGSAGWFNVYPGHCTTLIDKPLTENTYFVHGRSALGHQGPLRHWTGTVAFCIDEKDFTISGADNCERRGFREAMFDAVEIGRSKSWVTTFTEPKGHGLKKAGVLGTQRLLADLGYLRGDRIDGYAGPGTRRAIQKFKRAHRVNVPSEPTPELFRALLAAAKEQASTAGFEVCNATEHSVWVAIGIPQDKAVTTKGWYELRPEACVKPVLQKLSRDFLYVYAETVDAAEAKLYWRGQDNLCANDIVFSITSLPGECAEEGLKSLRFRKIDTEGRDKWTHFIQTDDASGSAP